jgi:hypothetical protein
MKEGNMKILAIYSTTTEKYIKLQIQELDKKGYNCEAIEASQAIEKYGITTIPSYCILKNNKVGYFMYGKHPLVVVLEWIKSSGI